MEKLNEVLRKEIEELEIKTIDDCSFLINLNKIILDNKKYFKLEKYKNKINLEKNFKHAYNFLNSISEEYGDYLLKKRTENIFKYVDEDNMASSDLIDGKSIITLPISNTIEDSYTIVHEIIHDMNIGTCENVTRNLFCEVFSLLAEILQKDYFQNNIKVKEYLKNNREIINAVLNKALTIDIEMTYIDFYLSKGYITDNDFLNIAEKYRENLDIFVSHSYKIVKDGELSFSFDQRYIVGILIASYMYERIQKQKSNIEFIELNEMLNKYTIEQFLTYLDLEYENNELTKESCIKLEKSYKKMLKGVG